METTIIIICAGIVDYKKRIIPNKIILILYLLSLFNIGVPIVERIAGFLIPALPFFFIALKNKKLKGGDVKYLSAVGAYFGLYGLLNILFFGVMVAVIWTIIKKEKSVPLATIIAIGYVFCFVIDLVKGGMGA